MQLEEYILNNIDPEPDYLATINRNTHLRMLNPRMISGHMQGRLLSLLSKMIQPDLVLEIGTYTGYAALCLAEGLGAKGKLHTIECDDELEDFIRENFRNSPYNQQIELHIGDAKRTIDDLHGPFDLVFIDADKREYQQYYDAVLPKLRVGGLMIVDNTLWNDKVLEEVSDERDKQTQAILSFNKNIAHDKRVEKIILPLRDGLTLIRKK